MPIRVIHMKYLEELLLADVSDWGTSCSALRQRQMLAPTTQALRRSEDCAGDGADAHATDE